MKHKFKKGAKIRIPTWLDKEEYVIFYRYTDSGYIEVFAFSQEFQNWGMCQYGFNTAKKFVLFEES